MVETDLILKDWEMTKDRIKHFDDVIIRLRLQGIPIGSAILALGLSSFQYIKNLQISGISIAALIVALGSIYLIPIFLLDLVHYNLMLISVRHAKEIEALPKYKNKLQITTKLTSKKLTYLHTACTIIVYCGVIALGFILAFYVNTLVINENA
jgi:hypothetical protein